MVTLGPAQAGPFFVVHPQLWPRYLSRLSPGVTVSGERAFHAVRKEGARSALAEAGEAVAGIEFTARDAQICCIETGL
jgi:hypothetical protein